MTRMTIRTEVWEDNAGGLTLVRDYMGMQAEERVAYWLGIVSEHDDIAGQMAADLIWLAHDPQDCDLEPANVPQDSEDPDTPKMVACYEHGEGQITLSVGCMGTSALAYAGLKSMSERMNLR